MTNPRDDRSFSSFLKHRDSKSRPARVDSQNNGASYAGQGGRNVPPPVPSALATSSASVHNYPSSGTFIPGKTDHGPSTHGQRTTTVSQQHSDYYDHYDRYPKAQAYPSHPPRSSPPIPPDPHNSRQLPPQNMSDRYQGNYNAMAPRAPNYGDIPSPPTTYPTEYIPPHPGPTSYSYPPIRDPCHRPSHLPTMRHSHQMSYQTAERGAHAQVEANGPYARGSITNTKLTEEPAPVMANEEPTKNMRNAAQLTALNDSYARMSLSSTEEHAKIVRFQDERQLIPGPQSSRAVPPLNMPMPNRYQSDNGTVAPQVSPYSDVRSPNTTRPMEYAPHQIQASYTYPPAPDPHHHRNHLQSMHHSHHNSLPTTDSRQNNVQMSMKPDYFQNAPAGQYANQESSRFALDSLQDLTNEIQGRPLFAIASGGFGDIWKCYLVKSDGTVEVAVKSIRAFESDDDAKMSRKARRVRRELKVWGRLKHDCILPLWGVTDKFGPYPAMVCPWVDNGALTGYLDRHEDSLSPQDKFSILNDIALGLQYLHRESVVHGDLTGSNVLVYANGRACLSDFGLSTILLEFVGPSYLTSSIRGNIRWAAAELFDDEDEASVSLSTECDIYSFGSIFLQVLTCKVPYYNVKNDNFVLGQVIRGKKPEPPKESLLAHEHWEFIQRCWRSRAQRPSVEDVVAFVTWERQILSPYT